MEQVLVTGGTGNLGQEVLAHLATRHFKLSLLSSRADKPVNKDVTLFKGDLAANTGLSPAVRDADYVIHCASNPLNHQETDIGGTQNLLDAIDRKITRQLIYISIVGVDRSNYPYYRAKLAAENLIARSGIPYTILRATQFHSFILYLIRIFSGSKPGRILRIPAGMNFQPVEITEVALQLTDSLGKPGGLLPDFGGPEILSFEEMARNYSAITGIECLKGPSTPIGELYDLFCSGINLCPENRKGRITWKDYLDKVIAGK